MLDLRLFRKPAFAGAQIAAFAISSAVFALFLYLTLYLQTVLGYSPLATGVRFLPITLLAFLCAPIAGKLSAQLPARYLIGGGLGLCVLALLLMHGSLDAHLARGRARTSRGRRHPDLRQ